MRRWLKRILLLLVLLLIAAAVTVQIVLRSDVPRRVVVRTLEAQTGMRIEIGSLETGWRGRTTIRRLSISLPLESSPLLTAREVRAEHAGLLRLLLTRTLSIARIEADEPALHARPNERGGWNLLEAATLIADRQRQRRERDDAPVALPELVIRDALLTVPAPDGQPVAFSPITLTGAPDGANAWRGEAAFPPKVDIKTVLTVGGSWSHRVEFDLQQVRSLIEPWLPEAPERLAIAGTWLGEVRDGLVTARLALDALEAERATVIGHSTVTVGEGVITLAPDELLVQLAASPIEQARLTGGRIRSDAQHTDVRQLIVEAADIRAQLGGEWSRDDGQAALRARWEARSPDPFLRHQGRLDVHGELPAVGRKHIIAQLVSDGEVDAGRWQSKAELELTGRTWTTLAGTFHAQELRLENDRDETADLGGLSATLALDWPTLTVTQPVLPGAALRGEGRLAFDTRRWRAALAATNWSPGSIVRSPRLPDQLSPISFELRARGAAGDLTVESLRGQWEDVLVDASGTYQRDREVPLDLVCVLEAPLERLHAPDLVGASRTTATVTGSLPPGPVDLAMHGRTELQHVAWRDRAVDVKLVPWRGGFRAGRLAIAIDDVDLLDGRWRALLDHTVEDALTRISIQAGHAGLEPIVTLLDVPIELHGRADLAIDMTMRGFDSSTITADGSWQARQVTATNLVDAAGSGRIVVRDGVVRLEEMLVEEGDRRVAGEASFSLDEPSMIDVSLEAHRWPIAWRDAAFDVVVDARIDGRADLAAGQMRGEFAGAADVSHAGRPLGAAEIEGTLDDRVANVREIRGAMFGGTITGEGRIVLDAERWTESTLHASWSGINLADVDALVDLPEPLAGHAAGRLSIGPADDPRAPEPMRFDIAAQLDDATFGPITLGRPTRADFADADIATDVEERDGLTEHNDLIARGHIGRDRVMIERADWALADGHVGAWGRLTMHEGEPFVHLFADLERLDLQQFGLLAGQTARPMPGRVGGWVSAGGYVRAPHRLFGQSRLSLRESDLTALPFISLLYDTLNLSFGQPEPIGVGEADIRLEGEALELNRLTYFNRGTDIVARLTVRDLLRGRESPIDGVAAGGVRPLRDIDLPFFDQLDRIVGAVQSNAASVRIEGTLGEPKARVVPLAEVFGAIGRILRGGG